MSSNNDTPINPGVNVILTPEDVMERLDIGKNTMYSLLKSGEIKAFKIGRKWKIPSKELNAYIDKKVKV